MQELKVLRNIRKISPLVLTINIKFVTYPMTFTGGDCLLITLLKYLLYTDKCAIAENWLQNLI